MRRVTRKYTCPCQFGSRNPVGAAPSSSSEPALPPSSAFSSSELSSSESRLPRFVALRGATVADFGLAWGALPAPPGPPGPPGTAIPGVGLGPRGASVASARSAATWRSQVAWSLSWYSRKRSFVERLRSRTKGRRLAYCGLWLWFVAQSASRFVLSQRSIVAIFASVTPRPFRKRLSSFVVSLRRSLLVSELLLELPVVLTWSPWKSCARYSRV
mmetsp:Transcript_11115/g.33810  ORF Transcript_11115/g.33810 Transcript_11115/m.33810 type:complete len:215 (-) Transcript_11115:2449-3093(-)